MHLVAEVVARASVVLTEALPTNSSMQMYNHHY